MHAKYSERGLRILAFPSNQFGNQVRKLKLRVKLASLGCEQPSNVADPFVPVGARH